MKELAAEFSINRVTVSSHLHRAQVRLRRAGLSPEQAAEACSLYEAGWSSGRLAERLQVSADTVLEALRPGRSHNPATARRPRAKARNA